MAEYINKKELEEAFDNADPDVCESYPYGHSYWGFGRENVRDVIRGVPAADVAPVVHGRWIRPRWKNSNYCYDCSECGGEAMHRDYQWAKDGIYPICPNCGARMDGEADGSD